MNVITGKLLFFCFALRFFVCLFILLLEALQMSSILPQWPPPPCTHSWVYFLILYSHPQQPPGKFGRGMSTSPHHTFSWFLAILFTCFLFASFRWDWSCCWIRLITGKWRFSSSHWAQHLGVGGIWASPHACCQPGWLGDAVGGLWWFRRAQQPS